jgi:IS5 family transposase
MADRRLADLSAKGDDLERVESLVDFEMFREAPEAALRPGWNIV